MELDEIIISRAIIEKFAQKFRECCDIDIAIVGAGPSGLTCGYFCAKQGFRTVIFERKMSIGGGLWGGGMLMPYIVVQQEGKEILDEFHVTMEEYSPGYYTANTVEVAAKLTSHAIDAGTFIFNGVSIEDVVIREQDRVAGLVINWSAVELAKLHVDPLTIRCKMVVDATGHASEVCRVIEKKIPNAKLATPTGRVIGEKPMWAEVAERKIADLTVEVFPGVIVTGMAANAVMGAPRMGPIFGGMLMSGKRAAEVIQQRLDEK